MNLKRCLFIGTFLCMLLVSTNAWWSFSSSSTEDTEAEQGRYLKNSPVPFEMTTAEEKFLAEAKKYMGNLTPLDTCHQIVINRIKKSCSDINEVELAKLGVALLNCQSKSEGRRTYECTDDMELRDCTNGMDANTWNSYHIISNRARSICYATRQQQFRLKTEFTVNQLASQAENQMELMNGLQEGQRRLTEVADDTVIRVTAGQERLVRQQAKLHASYDDVQRSISFSLRGNVRALHQERMMIDSGRKQLKEMAKTVQDKLESATTEIQKQDLNRKISHRLILEDLNDIRSKAEEVWNKIDHSTLQMMSYHSETTQHYNQTMENLKIINDTIGYLIEVTNQMQDKIDNRLNWLTRHLGGTGDKLVVVTTCLMHAGYFLLATLCILFLNAPLFTRLVLLVAVPINAWSEINFDSGLSYSTLSSIISVALLGNWLYFYLTKKYFPSNADRISKSSPLALNSAKYLGYHETPNNTRNMLDTTDSIESLDESALTLTPKGPVGNTKRQLNLSYPEAASTPSSKVTTPRRRCGALTKTGSACKRVIANGGFKCTTHLRMDSSYIPDEC
ncbi:protein brambleberry-like [Pocillopora verrucosa]|uniref:protein brambleberry-like n=1 Tax=Pocillopora verrucosa TaxID=203993 RepID=UPI00334183C1